MKSQYSSRDEGLKVNRLTIVAAVVAAIAASPAWAQTPIPASTQFDITGVLQEATLGGPGTGSPAGGVAALQGGSLKVNGQTIIVPSNTIVILPASAWTWQELFALAPPPYGPTQSGLALFDLPAPLTTWEVHIQGNRVLGGEGGPDQYIAGLIDIHQASLSSGSGFINYMDYAVGEMRVGGTLGSSTTGARVRLNDPAGRFGRPMFSDARFVVDDANPTIAAGTGFPMCFPRTDPAGATPDAACPQSNRPAAVAPATGFAASIQMNNPVTLPGVPPNALVQAPFEVGDYVTYAGTLVADATITAGPWPGIANTYVSAHTIGNNVAIYTWPGTNPAYVSIEVGLIGTGGLTVIGAGEAAIRTRFEGMTTDPSRNIHLYGVDLDPATGATTDRDWGTIGVDPGPPTGAVKGRWRFRPPCTGTPGDQKNCTPPPAGTFLPPTREVRAVIEGLQSQNPANVAPACVPPATCATTTANGIFYGQYHAPIGEYIFPENVPGTPIVENNFNTLDFLAKGGYTSSSGVIATARLNPWPSNVIPAAACTPPAANAGGAYNVAAGGSVTLNGSATGTAVTLLWTVATGGGTITNPTLGAATYSALGATPPVTLTLTATSLCTGVAVSATDTATITIAAAATPTVNHVLPIAVFSGAPGSLVITGSDPNVPAATPLTFTVTQTGAPALLNFLTTQNPPTGATVTFTAPTLPVGQVTPSVVNLTITAQNTLGATSAPEFTTVTVKPLPDAVLITNAEYRTSKIRLVVTASSSVISPNVVLTLNPYVCAVPALAGTLPCPGGSFDPATIGNTFTNNGGGLYTMTLVGAPEPAVPPALPLTATSNLGTTSPAHGLDRIRN